MVTDSIGFASSFHGYQHNCPVWEDGAWSVMKGLMNYLAFLKYYILGARHIDIVS